MPLIALVIQVSARAEKSNLTASPFYVLLHVVLVEVSELY